MLSPSLPPAEIFYLLCWARFRGSGQAGFGHQFVTALLPPEPGQTGPSDPQPRVHFGPEQPEFQRLRMLLEGGWGAQMEAELGLTRESLPIIWDADFLLGPRDAMGDDTYVLCEINVSSVFPIPDESAGILADATVERVFGQLRGDGDESMAPVGR